MTHKTGSTSTMKSYYYAGATRVAMRTGSTTLNYLLGDHLGSQSITTNSSGARVAEERYMPWGESRYTYGSTPTTFKFTGQRLESSLGLYFYNARWYDASAGRFISADTVIPEQQGVQAYDRYAYVNNNPVKYIDPSGHDLEQIIFNKRGELPKQTKRPQSTSSTSSTSTLDSSLAASSEARTTSFDANLGGNNTIENLNETVSSHPPDYKKVVAGAALLFITEAVGIGLSVWAAVITTPAGPVISIPSFFIVFIAYHERTLPVFILGGMMIYQGLYPQE